jgi:hypothetical protein
MKNDETTPKYVRYVENIQQGTKTTERKWISKVDAKRSVYEELSLNLEPIVNDI